MHISRQNLRKILFEHFEKISPGCVEWNKKLQTIEETKNEEKEKFKIKFSDDTSYEADLIVGSDGINSQVRKFKFDVDFDVPLNYLGVLVVLGITQSHHFLSSQRVFQTMDGNTRLFAMPFSGNDPNHNIMVKKYIFFFFFSILTFSFSFFFFFIFIFYFLFFIFFYFPFFFFLFFIF